MPQFCSGNGFAYSQLLLQFLSGCSGTTEQLRAVCDPVTLVMPNQYDFDVNWNVNSSSQLLPGAEPGKCKILLMPTCDFPVCSLLTNV